MYSSLLFSILVDCQNLWQINLNALMNNILLFFRLPYSNEVEMVWKDMQSVEKHQEKVVAVCAEHMLLLH